MLRVARILTLVIGSIWLLPVSCFSGLLVGIPLFSTFHERHMDRGDEPHATLFHVVWLPGEAGQPFSYASLSALAREPKPQAARSFIMTPATGRIGPDQFIGIEYKVLSSSAAEQLIEVVKADGDYDTVSRYRATPTGFAPLFSKVTGPEFMFMSIPPAMAFAAALYFAGRWLRRRIEGSLAARAR